MAVCVFGSAMMLEIADRNESYYVVIKAEIVMNGQMF